MPQTEQNMLNKNIAQNLLFLILSLQSLQI